MRLGSLEFGIIKGSSDWRYDHKLACGCRIMSLGKIYFTWLADYCREHMERK